MKDTKSFEGAKKWWMKCPYTLSFHALTGLCLRAYLLRTGVSLIKGSLVSYFQHLIIIPAGWILLC